MSMLAHNWWAIALRGVAGILFGVVALLNPALSLGVLILLFGAYAIVDGTFNIIAAIGGRDADRSWWVLVLEGIAGVAAGVITFAMPGLTALVLAYLVAAWAVVTGVLEVAAAVRLRREIRGEWLLALSGVLSILFGIFMAVAPLAGALALVLWIGAYAVVFGAVMLGLAFRLRRHARQEEAPLRRAA
jgi:uncharacterized membrane protein HdeD (DUF308 family)